jgi:hypothetical protein
MKTSLLLASIMAVALMGCSTETRETVVEKPPTVVQVPMVVQVPAVQAPAVQVPSGTVVVQPAQTQVVVERPRSCTYHAQIFFSGSESCQKGYPYRCEDGTWLSQVGHC